MEKGERIGILGGTFDPIHIGHLLVAQDALEALALSRVVFVPSASPPHKMTQAVAPGPDRLEMIRLAIRGNPGFCVSEIEFSRPGPSFSVDTVEGLRKDLGPTELFFLVGEDNLREIWSWREVERLFRICRVTVIGRAGIDRGETSANLPGPMVELDIRRVKCSSSEIRARVVEGRSIRYLVPPEVERYIYERKLYR